MRACIQRVSSASVRVDGEVVGKIGLGILVLLGVSAVDTNSDRDALLNKMVGLRIFEDAEEKMNLSLADVGGEILVVSQFTLYADCRKGRRPSFTDAAPPEMAERVYEECVAILREKGFHVETGRFRTMMEVSLVNDGPVTIWLDSKDLVKK
ncbi:MAG: D-tyrosyl-tRNA(Tyr) deacylase [Thermoguttaceae bacterium]|nr:D-tyrosyl-tRNA(Tyr) deacylase [Thermoguttaceae bacterium]